MTAALEVGPITISTCVESGFTRVVNATTPRTREESRMSPAIKSAKDAFYLFFEFHCAGMKLAGLPSRNILGKLMDEGHMAAGQKGSVIPIHDEPAWHQDMRAFIRYLTPIRRDVLVWSHSPPYYPDEAIAAKLNTSESRARNIKHEVRRDGVTFLSGRGWKFESGLND
jgi:hypothetical protein